MLRLVSAVLFSLVFIQCQAVNSKLVIDNDAGGDDAMAIFLSLLYEKYFDGPQVVALTTGNGNTNEDNVALNNQRILKLAKRQDIPIYRGSKSSIVTTPTTNAYYGEDGLGDTGEAMSDLVPAAKQGAVLALIELSKKFKDDLIVVTIGTLTNVALAIKVDPGFLGRLKQLYVAAGHIYNDDDPTPEFNAHMDVEAYHIVAQNASPDKVTIFPFSQVKASLNLTREWRLGTLGAIQSEIMSAQNGFERVPFEHTDLWHALDPAMLAVVVNPSLIDEIKYSKNDIIMCGEKRGINTNSLVDKEDANVRVIYSVKLEEFKKFLVDVFSAELNTVII